MMPEETPKPLTKAELLHLAYSTAGAIGGAAGTGKKKKRKKSHYQRIGRLGALARHKNAKQKPKP